MERENRTFRFIDKSILNQAKETLGLKSLSETVSLIVASYGKYYNTVFNLQLEIKLKEMFERSRYDSINTFYIPKGTYNEFKQRAKQYYGIHVGVVVNAIAKMMVKGELSKEKLEKVLYYISNK